jgi:hypothetical protein
MDTPNCRHIRINGTRCGSPALRNDSFCYYHSVQHSRHMPLNPPVDPALLEREGITAKELRDPAIAELVGYKPASEVMLNLPTIEDRDSLQLALSMVVTALGEHRIKPFQANSLISGLKLAHANLQRMVPSQEAPVTETELGADGQLMAA